MEGNMSISVSELASYLLERAVYILISGAEPVLLHKYQLRRLVLLCGTKLHKVELVVNDIFQQVCRLYFDGAGDEKGVGLKCYECPKNAERFFEVEVSRFARGECSNEAEPLREIDLRRDVLLEQYSRALRQQENPNDPPSPSGPPVAVKYVFWVNYKSIFNKIISASLTRFLAGAFITVQPTLRWQSALAVLQPSFATHGHPDTRQGGSIPCVVFIGGASGSGKSTLSSTLSLRLGITHVLSTDNVRELVRWESTHSQTGEVPPPELFVSTYEAFRADPSNQNPTEEEVVEAYKRQCGCILKKLRDIIFCIVVQQRKSIIVEGVHLLPDFISELSSEIRRGENNNVAFISTLVYIKDEEKHKERFFVRSKSMSLRPSSNKYVASFQYIRMIQTYLVRRAEALNAAHHKETFYTQLFKNTNVDKTISQIHFLVIKTVENTFKGGDRVVEEGGSIVHDALCLSSKKALAQLLLGKREKDAHKVARGKNALLQDGNDDRCVVVRARSIDDFSERFDRCLMMCGRDHHCGEQKAKRSSSTDALSIRIRCHHDDTPSETQGEEGEVGSLTSEPT